PDGGRDEKAGGVGGGPGSARRNKKRRRLHAEAKKADEAGERGGGRAGICPADREAEKEIKRTGDQSLQLDDLQRIGERYFPRQVVVEAPGDAGASNRERAGKALDCRRAGP